MEIRSAAIADCSDLAILDNVAGHGLPLWLWHGAVLRGRATDALEWGRDRYRDDSQPCNWRNARIADEGGETAGMAVGYALPSDVPAPSEADPVLRPVLALFARAAGTWLLDALAVFTRFRRRGTARLLLRDQIALAGDRPVSLVVADDNLRAIGLYESEAFQQTASEPFVPFGKGQATTQWLLMQRQGQEERNNG